MSGIELKRSPQLFRFAFMALAFVALGTVLSSGLEGASLLVLGPLFILGKILLIMLFFGAVGGFFWRSYDDRPQRPPWNRPRRSRRQAEPQKSREELFEEWHSVAHAREEVDTWVEDFD